MSNLDKFLIWERPCWPAFIYVAAEAVIIPHKKEYDWPWGNILYCFFSNGMIRAIWKKDEMLSNGINILNNFLQLEYFESRTSRYKSLTDNLTKSFTNLDNVDLTGLNDSELLGAINEYGRVFLEWWGMAQVAEAIAIGSEYLLKEGRVLTSEQFNTLTTPTSKSYTLEEEEELLQIVKQILDKPNLLLAFKEDNELPLNLLRDEYGDVYQLLKKHSQKYFWLMNGYTETKYLDVDFFVAAIKNIFREQPDITSEKIDSIVDNNMARLGVYKHNIENLEKELGLNEKEKRMVDLVDYFATFQDDRKRLSLIANYYLDLFIKEVARRSGVSYDLIRFSYLKEYSEILSGKFDLKKLNKRQEYCGFLFTFSGLEIIEGEEAAKRERDLLGDDPGKSVSTFEGMRAMGGKVRGVIRKIKNTEEISKMKDGEILVATMTSPDFVVAMRRAKAIITDEGGITCHAAVISRELGIPCVTGTKIATRVLNDGDEVEVNANHGIINIINKV